MKMWKAKTWQHELTGTDGNTTLFGVNIFDYSWNYVKSEFVDNQSIDIFSVIIQDREYSFGAYEVSNGVWDFYLFKY